MSLTFTEVLALQQIGRGQVNDDLDIQSILNNIRDKCHDSNVADASDQMRFATMNVKLWEWYKCASTQDETGQEIKLAAIIYHIMQMCAARNKYDIGSAVIRSLSDNDYTTIAGAISLDCSDIAMSMSSGLSDSYNAKYRQWGMARIIHKILAYGEALDLDIPDALAAKCDHHAG